MGVGNCLNTTFFWVGRGFLFAYSALLLISQLYSLLFEENIGESTFQIYVFYFKHGTIVASALIGLHACYTARPRHLRGFAVILLGITLVSAANAYASHTKRDLDEVDFGVAMMRLQPHYEWYKEPARANDAQLWDSIQSQLECCGLKSADDWEPARPSDYKKNVLPHSCCARKSSASLKMCTTKDAFGVGCLESYMHFLDSKLVFLISSLIQTLVLMMLALCVASSASRRECERFERLLTGQCSFAGQPQHWQAYLQFTTANQKPPSYAAASAPPSYGLA